MFTPEYEQRLAEARAKLANDSLLSRLHEGFSKCMHARLHSLPLGVQHNVSWVPREEPALVLRDETHYRWATMAFVRDPECDSKNGRCGNCMFSTRTVITPQGNPTDTLTFIIERTVLTSQTNGKPWKDVEELFALTPERFITQGRLATRDDIDTIHRLLHPKSQEQAS